MVSREGPSRSEFAQLVTNHILGDEDGDVFLAVIDGEGLLYESGIDRGTARPGLDDLFLAALLDRFNLL
jgi:hypothetical protein